MKISIAFFTLGLGNLASPIFGAVCDKYDPLYAASFGALSCLVSTIIMAVTKLPSYGEWIGLLALTGVATAAEFVFGFAFCQRRAVENGFPDNVRTYGLVSSLFQASFALGNLIGAFSSSMLYHDFGFHAGIYFLAAQQCLLLLLLMILAVKNRNNYVDLS